MPKQESNFQKPSIGRIVIYVADEKDLLCQQNGATECPAIVTRVLPGSEEAGHAINLKAFTDGYPNEWRPDVPYSAEPIPYSWHWPERV